MIFNFGKFKKTQYKKGMTYVELIVVLSIFSIMSAITLVDYGKFQARVDIKNLANDIALQVVSAQKNAMAGKLPIGIYSTGSDWKPAYGVRFDLTKPSRFKYFADVNSSFTYDPGSDSDTICQDSSDGECIDLINITRGNKISHIEVFGSSCTTPSNLDIVFRRPDSSTRIYGDGVNCGYFKEAIIGISSQEGVGAKIYIYPSGRIEIK